MQYSNLKNEDHEEERANKVTQKIAISTEVLLKKKEFAYFLVFLLVLIITSTVIFLCVRSGGKESGSDGRRAAPTTTSTTTTTTTPGTGTLLHTDRGYNYYKVAVPHGSRLEEGRVSETCRSAGLRAVCSGPQSCKYTDTTKCLVTPLSTNCNNPMSVTRDHDTLITNLLPPQVPALQAAL